MRIADIIEGLESLPPSVEVQDAALRLLQRGHSVAEVADTFDVSRQTVYNWKQKWSLDG